MDSSSWINAYGNSTTGNSGFMCGYAAGLQCRDGDEQQQQHDLLVTSQMQHHLNQISMEMSMDDESALYNAPSGDGAALGVQHAVDFFLPSHHAASSVLHTSSSTSSSFRSASISCSPENSSAQVLTAPTTGCLQFPEVSSNVPLMVLPYDDHQHQYVNFDFHDDTVAAIAAPGGNAMSTTPSAFKRYARHLGPRHRRPKPACGQRMFKTAISVLTKMHTGMRHQSYYYQQAAAAEPLQPSGNQLQHMISERKRREKLNDSFHALKTVLPPGSKKDKTSILITAREYVNSLKSKVCELEEKNQVLQAQLAQRANSDNTGEDAETKAGEKVEIEITRDDSTADQEDQVCTVKIAVIRSECSGNMTNVVLGTLQRLKDEVGEDVTLVAMSSSDVDGGGEAPRASLTMQLKSASGAKWEEAAVREAVAKAVADALPVSRSQSTETITAPRRGETGRSRVSALAK